MAGPLKKSEKSPEELEHEKWFMRLDSKEFVELQRQWNNRNLEIKLKRKKDYDDWLNYFKSMSVNQLIVLSETGLDILPAEGYAALSFWRDIMQNPSRIKSVHQAGLSNKRGSKNKSILELAQANDLIGVLHDTRDKIAEKLDRGGGTRDSALLMREMKDVMAQIADYERKSGPKLTTALGSLRDNMPNKSPREKGKGARNTSYRAKSVTIDDLRKK